MYICVTYQSNAKDMFPIDSGNVSISIICVAGPSSFATPERLGL